jgi:hypothetical protein
MHDQVDHDLDAVLAYVRRTMRHGALVTSTG